MTNIQTAIEFLSATSTSEGYKYYAHEICEEVAVTEAQLEALGAMLAAGREDAYSHWCAEVGS
jgi:hypothetical protein